MKNSSSYGLITVGLFQKSCVLHALFEKTLCHMTFVRQSCKFYTSIMYEINADANFFD